MILLKINQNMIRKKYLATPDGQGITEIIGFPLRGYITAKP